MLLGLAAEGATGILCLLGPLPIYASVYRYFYGHFGLYGRLW